MNSEEEYSESNTIFGAFPNPVPGSVTKLLGSDAGTIFGFRGDFCVGDRNWFLKLKIHPDRSQSSGTER